MTFAFSISYIIVDDTLTGHVRVTDYRNEKFNWTVRSVSREFM